MPLVGGGGLTTVKYLPQILVLELPLWNIRHSSDLPQKVEYLVQVQYTVEEAKEKAQPLRSVDVRLRASYTP